MTIADYISPLFYLRWLTRSYIFFTGKHYGECINSQIDTYVMHGNTKFPSNSPARGLHIQLAHSIYIYYCLLYLCTHYTNVYYLHIHIIDIIDRSHVGSATAWYQLHSITPPTCFSRGSATTSFGRGYSFSGMRSPPTEQQN